jgi:hypothetical protein
MSANIVQAVIQNALGEVGVREIGNTNRGRRVDEYQRADLLPGLGYPWCASFQAWNLLTVLGKTLCDQVWYRSASCDEILNWARRKKIIGSTPAVGACGLVMASKYDATHIFLVTDIAAQGVKTVEGNTNTGGSRNGNGVYARFRKNSSRYLYVNWAALLPQGATAKGAEVSPVAVPAPLEGAQMWPLLLGGKQIATVPLIEGRAWLPAWKWAHWIGGAWQEKNGVPALGWNREAQSVVITGREVAAQPKIIEGRAWLPVTKLAAHNGLKAFDDGFGKVVIQ